MKTQRGVWYIAVAFLGFLLLFPGIAGASGDRPAEEVKGLVSLTAGDSELLRFDGLLRAAVGSPQVADVAVISDRELMLNARSPGRTTLHVWDKQGVHLYRVEVDRGEAALAREIQELIALDRVSVRAINGTILLEGRVERPEDRLKAEGIARAYFDKVLNLIQAPEPPPVEAREASPQPSPEGEMIKKLAGLDGIEVIPVGDVLLLEGQVSTQNDLARVETIAGLFGKKVVNLLSVKSPLQVLLQVQVIEARRNLGQDLGVRWAGITGQGLLELPEGKLVSSVSPESQLPLPQIGILGEIFAGSAFQRLSLLQARLEALAQQGLVKLLAAPSMLTLSGSEANFLAGGEIPVYLGEEDGKIRFEWKPYGVQLRITPKVERDGFVDLKVNPEVSSFDWENALLVNGWRIPAFKTRRAQSHLVVREGSTIVLGGLIQSEDMKIRDKIPLLGDLPIIGALFRSERFQRQETELLIFVTPWIVRAGESVSPEIIKHPHVPERFTDEVGR